ncbi:TetR/AcrR family transcriptional regulator [Streptomyces albidoflavus]|uniref:TetR/AcrR family transcriptional regulator n=1 Tax=Streptomyces albidoflavus TaxID=1886 RepID=UPI00340E38E8
MKQERALRTRESLIRAAADAFASGGFEATSLGRICTGAGTSMGALTFHFRSKAALADTVQRQGVEITGEVVRRISRTHQLPLETVIAITLAVVGLLEESSVVRAAAGLSRERGATASLWHSSWVPVIEEHVTRVPEETLGPGTHPRVLLSLATHLVTGAEALIHTGGQAVGPDRVRPVSQVAEIWEFTLRGATPAVRLPGAAADRGAPAERSGTGPGGGGRCCSGDLPRSGADLARGWDAPPLPP